MDNQERYIEINGQQIPVNEEVYRTYKRPICAKCSRTKEGSVLSLDGLDEAGFSISDRAQDVAEIVAEKMLLEELFKALEELDPNSYRICELLMGGHSKREIARIMAIPQSSFEYQFKKLMVFLGKRLEKYI